MERVDVVGHVRNENQKITDELDSLKQLENSELKTEKINQLFLKSEQVKKYVHQHLSSMISYDIRICNSLINDVENLISYERDLSKEKSAFKFTFNFGKSVPKKNDSNVLETTSSDTVDANASSLNANITGFKNFKDETKTLDAESVDSKDVVLDSMNNCKVFIKGSPCSLRILNLKNCFIFCGPVSSSVFISECNNCVFQIACQQSRIHDSTECMVFLHVTSRSVIENSSKLKFGCFSWEYDELGEDFKKSGLDLNTNNWNQVDDFDCLVKPSPNYTLIE